MSAFRISFSKGSHPSPVDTELLVYGATALIFWFIPLLNRLHVESMAALAFIAFFTAGRASYDRFIQDDGPEPFRGILLGRLVRLLLPIGLLTFAVIWAPNCDYVRGLLFAPLFPGITVVLAVSLAYLLAAHGIRFRFFVLLGFALTIAGPIFDIGFHPQFYTYNHVFGGVLGPIYDEELAVRPGLFTFRGLTLLWAALCYLAARRKPDQEVAMRRIGVVVLLIGLVYLFSAYLGFNTPSWYLQDRLSGLRRTAHFAIHYDAGETKPDKVERWAEEHEYRYARLQELLGIDVPGIIDSYLYPNETVRASLTGARFTSVAPVWLKEPQVHVLASQVESVFPHELAHVFSREFGMPLLKASVSVGLVEGFAVAMEPPDGRPSPDELVAASDLYRDSAPDDLAKRVAGTLSATGFWTGRGAVSYTVSGSFVRFLMHKYGTVPFEEAYAWAEFHRAYGASAEALATDWISYLGSLTSIDLAAARRAAAMFSIPSLFERDCPHWIPSPIRKARRADELLDGGETSAALAILSPLMERHGDEPEVRVRWSRAMLASGEAGPVRDALRSKPDSMLSPIERRMLGDAQVLTGDALTGRGSYDSVRRMYPQYARDARAMLALREQTANDPDIVRILVSAEPVSVRRQRLQSLLVEREIYTSQIPSEGLLWRSILEAEDEDWAAALTTLENVMTLPDGPCSETAPADIRLRCPVWAASYADAAGDIGRASAYADSAIRVLERAGDISMIRAMEDFKRKVAWVDAHGLVWRDPP